MGNVIYLDLEGYHRADCLKGNKTAECSVEVEQAEMIDVGSSKLDSQWSFLDRHERQIRKAVYRSSF